MSSLPTGHLRGINDGHCGTDGQSGQQLPSGIGGQRRCTSLEEEWLDAHKLGPVNQLEDLLQLLLTLRPLRLQVVQHLEQYIQHFNTPNTSGHPTLQYTQHFRTPNTSGHPTLQYTQYFRTPNTSGHPTLQYTQHFRTPNTSVHPTFEDTQHFSTANTSVHLTLQDT